MQKTIFNTITLPQITSAGSPEGQTNTAIPGPTPIAAAGDLPVRILIRNVSLGVTAYLSIDDVNPLNALPLGPGPIYQLPAGVSEVFVLAPRQRILGSASGLNCQICIAVSEALPLDLGIGFGPMSDEDKLKAAYPKSAGDAARSAPIEYKKG